MKKYEVRYDREGNAYDPVQLAKNLLMTGHIDLNRTPSLFGISNADLRELEQECQQEKAAQTTSKPKPKGKPHLRLL